MKNIVEIKNLTKIYDNFKLDSINIFIPEGSIVGVVGQNGAGKTTLIKLILEIINKNDGKINIFNGKKINDAKEDIGVVLDGAFFPEILKINDINCIMKSIYKNWDEAMFKNYLKEFKLGNNKSLKELSTGMKKKLEIAVSLSHHPKLLILDEPTSGLDPIVRNEILDIFLKFVQNEENSILFSSHITSDLETIADYIIFIENGKVILNKPNDDLKNDYSIVKCTDEDFKNIDKDFVIAHKKNKYDYELLISNKNEFQKKYKKLVIENASIENIMLLMLRGEK